jgi:hypothetical protein
MGNNWLAYDPTSKLAFLEVRELFYESRMDHRALAADLGHRNLAGGARARRAVGTFAPCGPQGISGSWQMKEV